MTRSLFFNFFLRLAVAMGLVLGVRSWLKPDEWWLRALFVLGFASLNAWILARSVRASILPLQASVATLGQPKPPSDAAHETLVAHMVDRVTDQRYSDFDALARGIARAMREIQISLAAASNSRDELAAMIDSLQDAVISVDAAGRILWTSQRMQRLLSTAAGSIRTGHSIVQTIRDPEVLEVFELLLNSGISASVERLCSFQVASLR